MKKRYTFIISEEAIKALKLKAVQEDKSYSQVIEEAIELYLKTD